MNRSTEGLTITGDLPMFTTTSGGASITAPARSYASFIHNTPEPVQQPKRVYRVVLSRGVQEVTSTTVSVDEGFLKFYNVIPNMSHGFNTSVVAMIPVTAVQLVTSTLEEDNVQI